MSKISEAGVELGRTYRDRITGFEGVATAIATYITGCDQVSLQPKARKGEFVAAKWFDDSRLVELSDVEPVFIPDADRRAGGPEGSAPVK